MEKKSGLLTERNEFVLKSIENFKVNKEPALTPLKQRNGFNFLPAHSTPPSNFSKIKNPFEKGIIDGLHMSFCSPTIFSTQQKNSREDDEFEWTIDEIAEIYPADIEICNSQFEIKSDLFEEKKAQAAIENYFRKEHFIVSPDNSSKNFILPTDAMKNRQLKDSADKPEVEQILNSFCTYFQEEQDSHCNKALNLKNETIMKNLFKDDHILCMSNDALRMDYNTLTPISKSPPISSFMRSRQKINHGTPALYTIPSPSSVSPINKELSETPLLANNKFEKISVRKKNLSSKLLYNAINSYPFCQSTPEKNQSKQEILELEIKNAECAKSSEFNQCFDDYQCNFLSTQASANISKFEQDMSVDVSRTDLEVIDSPMVINHASSVFGNNSKHFVLDNYDNELIPLSPLQKSQMDTPLKKRSTSAKNLSRSFDLPETNESRDQINESAKIDSGFTEINTFDLVADTIKYHRSAFKTNFSKQCYNCNNVSNINISNFKTITDTKCNYCQRQFEIF